MSLSVSAPFGWRCLTSPRVRRTPAPPRRIPPAGGTLRSPSATRLSRGAHTRYAGTRLSAHAIPATPEGPGGPWQLWRPAWHRPSPNVHRVGTLSLTLTGSCHNGRVLDNGMGGELG